MQKDPDLNLSVAPISLGVRDLLGPLYSKHIDPKFKTPEAPDGGSTGEYVKLLTHIEVVERGERTFYQVRDRILKFQNELSPEEEIGVCLTNFGSSTIIALEGIKYGEPDLVIFHGLSDGKKVELVQHLSQLSILLMRMPAQEDPPKRIGFTT